MIQYHCYKILNLKAYDVQLEAAIRLFEGNIIEMGTGEGKTLVAIITACMHVLNKHKVHIITANDYLVQRDYAIAKPVFESLGFKCGYLINESTLDERIESSNWDILYTTNKEIAVNFSNNRKALKAEDLIHNPFDVLIVDEADLLMIDEARKELSIGNNYPVDNQLYVKGKIFAEVLHDCDYVLNDEKKDFKLTDLGIEKAQIFFDIPNYFNSEYAMIRTIVKVSIIANKFFIKDVDYIVRDNEIVLINKQTGRLMNFYKMLNGLQQAIECKEGLPLSELRTSFTKLPYQFIFNRYVFKSGMTGTAITEENEFKEIYQLKVIKIPTNKPCIRIDYPDRLFATKEIRDKALILKIKELYFRKQPVLIGTASIEHSEAIAKSLDELNIPYYLLNAKNHKKESTIIQKAGDLGSVTIATNMAGRGTDIKVPKESLDLGGLFILGTERFSSRRADNQLRGRTGRQGDVGETQFYTSLEDDIVSHLNFKRAGQLMGLLKNTENKDYIENPTVLSLYDKAQITTEGQYYMERKQMMDNNSTILEHYQNFFGRKLFLMQTKPTMQNFLVQLRSGLEVDKQKYKNYFKGDTLNNFESKEITENSSITLNDIYPMFNEYWARFINQVDALGVNSFLNFSVIGDKELLYKKQLNELYSKLILDFKLELISILSK